MKFLILSIAACLGIVPVFGQGNYYIESKLYQEYEKVSDSLAVQFKSKEFIHITTCSDAEEYYFLKDSNNHWRGVYLVTLLMDGIGLPDIEEIGPDGKLHTFSHPSSKSVVFPADSIVEKLFDLGIYDVEQLTDADILRRYNYELHGNNNKIISRWPIACHDCDVTITINLCSKRKVKYLSSFTNHDTLKLIEPIGRFRAIIDYLESLGFDQ